METIKLTAISTKITQLQIARRVLNHFKDHQDLFESQMIKVNQLEQEFWILTGMSFHEWMEGKMTYAF